VSGLIRRSAVWVALALALGSSGLAGWYFGWRWAAESASGYLLQRSHSVENIFATLMLTILGVAKIPALVLLGIIASTLALFGIASLWISQRRVASRRSQSGSSIRTSQGET